MTSPASSFFPALSTQPAVQGAAVQPGLGSLLGIQDGTTAGVSSFASFLGRAPSVLPLPGVVGTEVSSVQSGQSVPLAAPAQALVSFPPAQSLSSASSSLEFSQPSASEDISKQFSGQSYVWGRILSSTATTTEAVRASALLSSPVLEENIASVSATTPLPLASAGQTFALPTGTEPPEQEVLSPVSPSLPLDSGVSPVTVSPESFKACPSQPGIVTAEACVPAAPLVVAENSDETTSDTPSTSEDTSLSLPDFKSAQGEKSASLEPSFRSPRQASANPEGQGIPKSPARCATDSTSSALVSKESAQVADESEVTVSLSEESETPLTPPQAPVPVVSPEYMVALATVVPAPVAPVPTEASSRQTSEVPADTGSVLASSFSSRRSSDTSSAQTVSPRRSTSVIQISASDAGTKAPLSTAALRSSQEIGSSPRAWSQETVSLSSDFSQGLPSIQDSSISAPAVSVVAATASLPAESELVQGESPSLDSEPVLQAPSSKSLLRPPMTPTLNARSQAADASALNDSSKQVSTRFPATVPPSQTDVSATTAAPAVSETVTEEINLESLTDDQPPIATTSSKSLSSFIVGEQAQIAGLSVGSASGKRVSQVVSDKKIFEVADGETIADGVKSRGITNARSGGTMKSILQETSEQTGLEHGASSFGSLMPAFNTGGSVLAELRKPSEAGTLVEKIGAMVDEAVDKLSASGRGTVNMNLSMEDGQTVNVRMQLRDGTLHTSFHTADAALGDAINREWASSLQGVSYVDSGIRLADPVFSFSGQSQSNGQSAFGADQGQQGGRDSRQASSGTQDGGTFQTNGERQQSSTNPDDKRRNPNLANSQMLNAFA